MTVRTSSKTKRRLKILLISIVAAIGLWLASVLVTSGWLTDTLAYNEIHYIMVVTDLEDEELKSLSVEFKKVSIFDWLREPSWETAELWEESDMHHILLRRGCYLVNASNGEITRKTTLRVDGKSDVYAVKLNFHGEDTLVDMRLHNYADPNAKLEWQSSLIPEGAFYWQGHTYSIYVTNEGWDAASSYCESRNGHLATITSSEENEALYGYVTDNGYYTVYFGLVDESDTNNDWCWVTDEELDYTNWHEGEPNSSYEKYGSYFWEFGDSTWNDGSDPDEGGDVAYLCEWDY